MQHIGKSGFEDDDQVEGHADQPGVDGDEAEGRPEVDGDQSEA